MELPVHTQHTLTLAIKGGGGAEYEGLLYKWAFLKNLEPSEKLVADRQNPALPNLKTSPSLIAEPQTHPHLTPLFGGRYYNW